MVRDDSNGSGFRTWFEDGGMLLVVFLVVTGPSHGQNYPAAQQPRGWICDRGEPRREPALQT